MSTPADEPSPADTSGPAGTPAPSGGSSLGDTSAPADWVPVPALPEGLCQTELTGCDDTFGLRQADPCEDELPAGTELGGATISCLLGTGGMGKVYEARQHRPERLVAMKLVDAKPGSLRWQRLEAEAALLAHLTHPHIAQVYTAGVSETAGHRFPWLMMELVGGGQPITDYARANHLPWQDCVRLVAAAADAVAAAHSKGVIHLDLKPSNILVDRHGTVKVIDFGIGRRLGEQAEQRQAGQVLGTPASMSPEQRAGLDELIDARSDVYGLGLVLAAMLSDTQRDAAEACSPSRVPETKRQGPTWPRGAGRAEAADLHAIVSRCLEENPAARFATMRELHQELERVLADLPVRCRPGPPVERAGRWARRNPVAAMLLGAVVLTTFVAGVAILVFAAASQQARRQAEQAADDMRLSLSEALLRQAVSASHQQQPSLAKQLLAERTATLALLHGPPSRPLPADDGVAIRCLKAGLDQSLASWQSQAGLVTAVAVAAGGHRAVVATAGGQGTILSLAAGGLEPAGRFLASDGPRVWAAAITATGDRAAVAGAEGVIRIIDLGTGRQTGVLSGHEGTVYGLVFMEQGTRLLSGGSDGTVRLWDVEQQHVLKRYGPAASSVYGVACSSGAGLVAAATRAGPILLWDATTATEYARLQGHQRRCFSVAFSPDGNQLASTGEDKTVRVWDLPTQTERVRFEQPVRGNVVRFAGPRRVICGGGDQLLRCWSLDGTATPRGLPGHEDLVWSLAGGDGAPLLTASADGTVRRWENTGDPQPRLPLVEAVKSSAIFANGRYLAVGTVAGGVAVWEPATGTRLAQHQFPGGAINDIAWHRQTSELLVAGGDGLVSRLRFDPSAEEVTQASLQEVGRLSGHRRRVFAVAGSPEGNLLATAGEDGTVRLWEKGKASASVMLENHGRMFAVTFEPGKAGLLAAGGEEGLLRLFDRDGTERFRGVGHESQINTICFAPAGETRWLVASGDADGLVRLWKRPTAETGTAVPANLESAGILTASSTQVWQLLPIPGEPLLAAATQRGEVVLWETTSPTPLEILRGHQAAVWTLQCGPAGRGLWSGGHDGYMRLWDTAPRDWTGWQPSPVSR